MHYRIPLGSHSKQQYLCRLFSSMHHYAVVLIKILSALSCDLAIIQPINQTQYQQIAPRDIKYQKKTFFDRKR